MFIRTLFCAVRPNEDSVTKTDDVIVLTSAGSDVIHRQMVLVTNTDQAARDLFTAKVNFVSSGVIANQMNELDYRSAFIVRAPDGHAVEIEQK